MTGDADKGTYTLLVRVEEPVTLRVGALGDVRFDEATYTYTGSAFGTGGLARLDRHAAVATGENGARHWHIDYLLGAPETQLVAAYTTPADAECELARAIAADAPAVKGFGASDCDCAAHLHRADSSVVRAAYSSYDYDRRVFD